MRDEHFKVQMFRFVDVLASLRRGSDIVQHLDEYFADMRNGYFACDLLVHPTFYDPCSNVVLEALACGLPVITSRHNGASELMRPAEPGAPAGERREGYVVADPHDHAELAGCLQRLLDPARRGECAAEARQTAAGWTFEHHYVRMLAVFAEAAARRRAA